MWKTSFKKASAVLGEYFVPVKDFVRWLLAPSGYGVRDPMDLLPYLEKEKWVSETELRMFIRKETKMRWWPSQYETERALYELDRRRLILVRRRVGGGEEVMKL